MEQRLQKLIAASGLCSRRAAEALIREGKVTVNGTIAFLGASADPDRDEIRVRGKALAAPGEKHYIMLYKPRGYVTTMHDERGRKCVSDLVSVPGLRLVPVGRLDLNSEGLLLMTNDGETANRLMHPSRGVVKLYRVTVSGEDLPQALERLGGEFTLDGRTVRAVSLAIVRQTEARAVAEIGVTQGLNRQVRRMCEAAGLRVHRLIRIAEGELRLDGLKSGQWRYLSAQERDYLLGL